MKLLWLAAAAVIIVLAALSLMSQPTTVPGPVGECQTDSDCFVGGCSSEVCSAQEGVVSTCIYKPEYDCYRQTTCGCVSGNCSWNSNPEFDACLTNASGPRDVQ